MRVKVIIFIKMCTRIAIHGNISAVIIVLSSHALWALHIVRLCIMRHAANGYSWAHMKQPQYASSLRLYTYASVRWIPCNLLRIILLDHSGLNYLKSKNDCLSCMSACIFGRQVWKDFLTEALRLEPWFCLTAIMPHLHYLRMLLHRELLEKY